MPLQWTTLSFLPRGRKAPTTAPTKAARFASRWRPSQDSMNENPGEQQQPEQRTGEQSNDSMQALPRPTPFVSSEGKPCPILYPDHSLTASICGKSKTLRLEDLTEAQFKQLEIIYKGLTGSAKMRSMGCPADYFLSEEEEALMPYLPIYRERFNLPLVAG